MKLFIDTEFNGYKGDLLSIALVAADGRYFYKELHFADDYDPWVKANVLPFLHGKPETTSDVQIALQAWLLAYDAVEIIADWPDDIRYFCELLITGPGVCINTPPLSFTIIQHVEYKSAIPHNALADAMGIQAWYLTMRP